MQQFYDSHANKPGIYKILNTHTSRIYIGQAQSLKKRWSGHASSLRTGKHQNKFLLHDFNKCKAELNHDDFLEFRVLEVMEGSTKEERNAREAEYIAQHFDNQDKCYNFKKDTSSKEKSCWSLTPEETRKKVSQTMKMVWENKPEEEKQAFFAKSIEAHRGKKCTPEQVEANRLGHLGQIPWNKGTKMPSISGENHYLFGKSLDEKTKEKLSKSLKGRTAWNKGNTGGTHAPLSEEAKAKISEKNKGKKLSQEHIEKISKSKTGIKGFKGCFQEKVYENINLLSPDGTIYNRIDSLKTFCIEHDLTYNSLWGILKGRTIKHKGWKLLPSAPSSSSLKD